ncbi:MAG: endonuclease/exonuclease/phosphatase family protein, partial [Propionibacteriaceae bacterium]|nr:endonuclease/exonuclease/phosphatase family protein [Propionibacteriaceae bacterium]
MLKRIIGVTVALCVATGGLASLPAGIALADETPTPSPSTTPATTAGATPSATATAASTATATATSSVNSEGEVPGKDEELDPNDGTPPTTFPNPIAVPAGFTVGSFNVLGCLHGYNYPSRMATVASVIATRMNYAIVGLQEYGSTECKTMLIDILNTYYGGHWASTTLTSRYGMNDTGIIYDTNWLNVVPESERLLDLDQAIFTTTSEACRTTSGSLTSGANCGYHVDPDPNPYKPAQIDPLTGLQIVVPWTELAEKYRQSGTRYARMMQFKTSTGLTFTMVSVHFPAYSYMDYHRVMEMTNLMALLGQVSGPIMLVGDLNGKPSEAATYQLARNAGFSTAYNTSATAYTNNIASLATSGATEPIDQILYRGFSAPLYYETMHECTLDTYDNCAETGSDHKPVRAVLGGVGGQLKTLASTPTPVLGGTLKVGRKVKVTATGWSSGGGRAYQWYRNGVAIPGATKSRYVVQLADVGKKLSASVSTTWASYKATTVKSASSATVPKLTFTTKPTPKISGTAKVKKTLKVKAGSWKP